MWILTRATENKISNSSLNRTKHGSSCCGNASSLFFHGWCFFFSICPPSPPNLSPVVIAPCVYPHPINVCRHRCTIMTTTLLRMTAREEERANGDPSQSCCRTLERSLLSGSRKGSHPSFIHEPLSEIWFQ